jgi:hypothetical protein
MDDIITKRLKNINHIYLSGGAFGVIYQIGALNKLMKYYKKYNVFRKPIIYGDSVGALIGVLFILGMSSSKQLELYNTISDIASKRIREKPLDISSYYLTEYPLNLLRKLNREYPDAYRLVSNKIFIGVVLVHKNGRCEKKWYSNFKSQKELFNILLCSFNIPFLSTYDAKITDNGNTMLAMDGCLGYEDMPEGILRIVNGTGEGELIGNISLYQSLVPPSKESMVRYYEKGKNDMRNKIKMNLNVQKNNTYSPFNSGIPLRILGFARKKIQPINTQHNLDYIFNDSF